MTNIKTIVGKGATRKYTTSANTNKSKNFAKSNLLDLGAVSAA